MSCSGALRITLATHGRMAKAVFATDAPLHEAEFALDTFFSKVDGNQDAFVYITVTAADGSYATTPAFSAKELLEK